MNQPSSPLLAKFIQKSSENIKIVCSTKRKKTRWKYEFRIIWKMIKFLIVIIINLCKLTVFINQTNFLIWIDWTKSTNLQVYRHYNSLIVLFSALSLIWVCEIKKVNCQFIFIKFVICLVNYNYQYNLNQGSWLNIIYF